MRRSIFRNSLRPPDQSMATKSDTKRRKSFPRCRLCNKPTNTKCVFIIYYYSPTCFGPFCDHQQEVLQEYKRYI